ncbi:UNVERIFIED_CONTAM: Trafficking protein particle complex subunit 10 [Siphonaria sp. JEL0065]|nr:Trafficking protein particle complex subunit 10 [Siphonaria sp. JEL0065]
MTVLVTYLDSSVVWFEVEAAVTSRVPLVGVTWLQHTRVQRLLDSIDVAFVPFRTDLFPRAVPGTASALAVHLFLVNCDDPDLYKTSVKKQLADWLAVVAAKKNQEPLIVYLSAPDAGRKQASSRLFGSSVFDKIKSDFNKTALINLKPTHPKDETIWTDFFIKLRELILSSFNGKLLQYDEDTRRLDAQRLLPGWNYCQFFILKV